VRYVETLAPGLGDRVAYKLGLELQRPSGRRRDEMDEVVTEPARILALLQEGVPRNSFTARLADAAALLSRGGPARLVRETRTVLVESDPAMDVGVGDVVEGRFDLSGKSYAFLSSVRAIDPQPSGPRLSLGLPRAVRMLKRRQSMRVRLHEGSDIVVTVTSPFTGESRPRRVLNITSSGIAFSIPAETVLLPIGTSLPRVVLRFGESFELRCSAVVRNLLVRDGDTDEVVCGIEFEGLSENEKGRLADAIVHSGKRLLRDGTGTSFDALWGFLTESRFLYPEKVQRIDVGAVRRTLTPLLARSNSLLKTSLVANGDKIEAHASGLRAYRSTWTLQHLAALPGGKSTMTRGRMLNLAVIDYMEQLPGIEWVKIWFRPTNRWPAHVFGGFATKLADPALSSLKTYSYMTSTGEAGPSPSFRRIHVRDAETCDFAVVESYFVGQRDAVLLSADDLTSRHLELGEISEAYASAGLIRRREVLIAERGEVPCGFALLEISSPGLNLSELTNTFRTFAIDADPEVHRALAIRARSRYSELGYKRVISLAGQAEEEALATIGFETSKQYTCWTWHRSLYQAFCEHVLRLRA
jgi:hypothetical protein